MARRRSLLGFVVLGTALALASTRTVAHKAITSKYTYNEHVYPIVRDRCGRCHYEGGPTPMSLLTYKDAVPWAESIREQLTSEAMPPWFADPLGPAVKGGHTISTAELDTLITWAVGGTPEGDSAALPAPVAPPPDWRLGTPDLVLTAPEQTLAPGAIDDTREFIVSTGLTSERWVKAIDVLPGTRSMVRSATIAIDNGPVLSAWVPGQDTMSTPAGTAFRVPAGAALRVRIQYKKHWQDEQVAKSDRSRIGMYFTDAPVSGRPIETLAVQGTRTVENPVRVLAVLPRVNEPYERVTIDAVLPTGRRVPLLALHAPRNGWDRRYWLAEPIDLPGGTKLEASQNVPVAVDVVSF